MSRLDWAAMRRVGLEVLRLRPEEFWALTPIELRLMTGEAAGVAPMTSAGLEALVRAFPDDKKDNNDGRTL